MGSAQVVRTLLSGGWAKIDRWATRLPPIESSESGGRGAPEDQELRPRELIGRDGLREIARVFGQKDLLVDAGALAFRGLITLIPGALFIVGLLGFFGLEEVWKSDIAPDLKDGVSPATFKFLDAAVVKVLGAQDVFWVTAGAALTAWEASAVVRAAGNMMNEIYEVEDEGSFRRELAESIPVGAAAGLLLLGALAAVRLGPLGIEALLGDSVGAHVASFIVCWAVALALLLGVVALVVRFAPAIERPPRWLSFGAGTIVVGWGLMSALFGLYLSTFASYASVFGSLATVFVLIEYLFLLAVVFLGGIVIDSIVDGRERHD